MSTWKSITRRQNTEVGVLCAIALFLLFHFQGHRVYLLTGLAVLVFILILPIIFKPLAVLWFGFSRLLASFLPLVLLTVLFYVLVTPVGLFRKFLGKDTLKLKEFKKDEKSVLVETRKSFTKKDFERAF